VTGSRPGLIFVHGGEHGGWCWERVLPLMDWPAVAFDLPCRGARAGDRAENRLVDNATELVNSVGRSGFDPYLLVCHSFGGLTVLAAEPLHDTPPAHRVFVSALTPAPGEAGLDALPILFRTFLRLRLWRPAAARRAVHLIPRWLAIRIWCRGLERADQELIMSRRCAESPRIAFEPTPGRYRAAASSTHVVLDRDRAMSPRLQQSMAARLGVRDVRHIDAGHEAMFSHPGELAAALNAVANSVFSQH
jgi:pimeloyl-ACP methyl ester carboxylesterase